MERNLRLLPVHQACHHAVFWLPVFFLYFASVLPVADVLLLEGAYYLFNVVLEVPSGWLSDRFGRKPTLVLAALAHLGACALFVFTSSLATFLVAQLGLAAAFALLSGTDTALLYDTLKALGRTGEASDREARLQRAGFAAMALACVVGGLAAGFDLRVAYVLSGLGAVAACAVALRLVEPDRGDERAEPFLPQLFAVARRVREPALLWIFVFAVAMRVLTHVPYEFLQPYVELLFASGEGFRTSPLVAGLLMGGTMLVSAAVSTRAVALSRRFGAAAALLGSLGLLALVILALGAAVHPALLPLLLLRGVPQALARPVVNARIHPRVSSGIRATYFSIQQLAGSLAFSGSLALASRAAAGRALDEGLLGRVLTAYGVLALAVVAVLAAARRALRG